MFTARKDYWNKGLQKYQKLTFKILTDLTARTNALVSGQVDATILDPKNGKQAEGAKMKLAANEVDWQGLLLLDRDGAKNPALANVKVRQAINYAFDRKTILDQVMLGQGTPTSQPFGKASGAWTEELENYYSYDPAKAKQLLKEAGYESGVTLEIPAVPGFETQISVVQQQLADVGITLKVGAALTNTFTSDVAAQKFTTMYFSLFQGEPTVAVNQIVSTKALYNPFKNTTPELQAKIEAVRSGGADAGKLAQEVNKYVVEQAWFAPLFRVNQMYYHNAKVNVTPQIQQAVPSIYNYSPATVGRHDQVHCETAGQRAGGAVCCLGAYLFPAVCFQRKHRPEHPGRPGNAEQLALKEAELGLDQPHHHALLQLAHGTPWAETWALRGSPPNPWPMPWPPAFP